MHLRVDVGPNHRKGWRSNDHVMAVSTPPTQQLSVDANDEIEGSLSAHEN